MHDVVIVGGRCAGAATALLLARGGHRVLVVDRDRMGSDMRMSTHLVHARGVAYLAKWGLLDAVRTTGTAGVGRFRMDFGAVVFHATPPAVGGQPAAYAPRRFILDALLARAAQAAGAEWRERCRVDDVLLEGGRAAGIRGVSDTGTRFEERATIVIGADGPSSTVARCVGAEERLPQPALQGTYWSYFRNLAVEDAELYIRPWSGAYAFPTSGGCVLSGANWTLERFRAIRDPGAAVLDLTREQAPRLAERLEAAERVEEWSAGATRSFVRRACGPGWALVGDAGYKKDPCTAQGITDAFVDAELLSEAIDRGLSGRAPLDLALADFERARDEWALPFYEFTCELATFAPPPPEMQQLQAALAHDAEAASRFVGMITEAVSPREFLAPENVARILAASKVS